MTKTFNVLKDLLSPEEYFLYRVTPYPFNLPILDNALKLKLEEDPDYEVFVPFFYYKYKALMRLRGGVDLLTPYKIFISNRGTVYSLRGDEPALITPGINNDYPTIRVPKVNAPIVLHRVMACCFIPVQAGLSKHPKDLQVNHIDGDKSNYELTNLEWCTSQGNIIHAFEMGLSSNASGAENKLSKPVKGTVLVGEFKGTQFILIGAKQCKQYGFDQSMIAKSCTGKKESHKNCSWSYANEEDITTLPTGISTPIKESLAIVIKTRKVFKSMVVATNLETNETFTIKGGATELIKLGFTPSGVAGVTSGREPRHKNHFFKRVPIPEPS